MIRNFGATGITNQAQGIDLGLGGGSNIKSIQRGSTNVVGSSVNVTISAIDITKAIARVQFSGTGGNSNGYEQNVTIKIVNSTTIQITPSVSSSVTKTVHWEVIELNNVKSLQQGMASVSTTAVSTTVSISSVDLSKSMIFYSFSTDAGAAGSQTMVLDVSFTNSTTITISYGGYGAPGRVAWQVIEFN